jgi:AraC-like DNA-binding protein
VDRKPDSFFIPSSYSRIVARELGLQERELPQLLYGTGLAREILLPGDETLLTGEQQVQVIANARRISGAPDFGLRLGRRLQPSAHGPIGYLALSSPDLLSALKALRDFLPLRIPFARLQLDFEQDWLRCHLLLGLPAEPESRRMLQECFALLVQALVEAVTGSDLSSGRFTFDYPKPAYHSLYGNYLHAPIEFSQAGNQVLLPADLALQHNTTGDPAAHALARDLCRQLLDRVPNASLSMGDRVRRLLLSQPMGAVSEEDVARALFVSKRTLARRLEREGCAYRGIREELLAEMAVRHLADSDLSIEAIAALLGYHDAANFRRAFRRWFQTTPAAYRRQSRGDGIPGTDRGAGTPGPTPLARRPRWQSDRLPQ